MAVIYASDLLKANSSPMLKSIDDIVITSDNLINQINQFISNSRNHLSGDVFTLINAKLSTYIDALTKQKIICQNLKSNIQAANNTMINYVAGYEKIDDSEKETIKSLINQIKSSIYTLDDKSKTQNYSLQKDINRLYEIYHELNRQYQKIDGLAAADASAFSKIETVNMDIENYSNAIRKVQIGWSNAFYNLGHRDVLYYDQRGYYNENGEFVEWQSRWNKSIKKAGCGPTSCATVFGTMFHDSTITPSTIANLMADRHKSNIGGGFISYISSIFGANCKTAKFSADAIEDVIKSGGGFIGSANNGDHFISVTDVVYIDGTRYFVLCDSWPEFNGNRTEPTLITEDELKSRKITMDFYITPSNYVVVTDEYGSNPRVEKAQL